MAWQHQTSKLTSCYYTWQLERPAPKLPNSYFWTWDHSTNWVLDDPGLQTDGCANPYLKRPETFIEDYRRLTDMAAGLGIGGIAIAGLLRDAHGGVPAAKRVIAYARKKGVRIYPIFGITTYNGVYYAGRHRYSLPNFAKRHPECQALNKEGKPVEGTGCVAQPKFQKWLTEGIEWLFREVGVDGVNLENGDFFVDHHPLVKKMRAETHWPADDAETFFHQAMSYRLALNAVPVSLKKVFACYATYSGFTPAGTHGKDGVLGAADMGSRPPAMFDVLPKDAVCQWTLTGMLKDPPLPLSAYWEDGAPKAVFDNPKWPTDLRPPSKRSLGFVHQGSQWWRASRHQCVVSSIKEACLRAYRSGLEGVSIHGEVSARYFNWALNYLAFSHFTHWPEDTLREFGRKTLSQVLGKEQYGEDFAYVLGRVDAGTVTEDDVKLANPANHGYAGPWPHEVERWQACRLWLQLRELAKRATNKEVLKGAAANLPELPFA